ncbi:hypothetical protein S1OALGB6SA_1109 [Olavius algarvensis spirochete endosymbiont]|nr:hypothetical protein JY97_08435 [Alkalispirochaeta odontotermitis]VDB00036.1 hypothetical protein S1OALGB6SA_1109 [Olavius algarvensis spirochete endosymbiont]
MAEDGCISGKPKICMRKAEELIVEVYRQLLEARSKGLAPKKVVISPVFWASIESYRRSLGSLSGALPDYLSKDALFGLEIWYGYESEIRVV